jgi:2-oxoglutarate dehydrogenase E1 component
VGKCGTGIAAMPAARDNMDLLTLFHGPNAGYVLELYERYLADPESVDQQTRTLFAYLPPQALTDSAPPTLPTSPTPSTVTTAMPTVARSDNAVPPAVAPALDVHQIVGAARLIRYVREIGHLDAQIDPLDSQPPSDPGLRLDVHGVTEADLAALPADIVRGPCVVGSANALEAFNKLRSAYSGRIGYETDHIQVYEERTWIRDAIESRQFFQGISDDRRKELLERLTEVEVFERFLHQTFVGQKRFSIEGCDMLVPMLASIIRHAAMGGTHEIVIGMAHRGRLNVLAHILGKPYAQIFAEFIANNREDGQSAAGNKSSLGWKGDVKYHLGARRAYKEAGIEEMPITMAPNPSHLEFVNPVVEGRARAAQENRQRSGAPEQHVHHSLPVLIHGDAAFPGQGIVTETLNLSGLQGYRTGGTIHIITNNQVGFTTDPHDSRSTMYSSDPAKGFEIPIVHVNADDVESCIAAARMAYAYREKFEKDFVIDLVGYRRWGHNEGDDPTLTQPTMYSVIQQHPTVRALWAKHLVDSGVMTQTEVDALVERVTAQLQAARAEAESKPAHLELPPIPPPGIARKTDTSVSADVLNELNAALMARPEGFHANQRLERQLERRRNALNLPHAIEWGHAETLAFASLLAEGVPIRLSGQDSERGTFNHRHLVLHDASGRSFCPLQELPHAKATFAVYNSPLSEAGVLGFEYGYSTHAPDTLVIWEAQFGDFANSAQVIIDQFLISARSKWGQTPSLVLLLPHGYEGQGPEHSSARLERFLQLAANDNIRVANCTTAAQYFHLLRRQAHLLQSDPRPLIVMTPKSLLRHPRAASSLHELSEGRFQRVIDDQQARTRPTEITRLVLCSGKVYVDLIAAHEADPATNAALVRVEELYSFPGDELREVLAGYPALQEVVWLQEEPRNMGAWSYMALRLRELLSNDLPLIYVGRSESASPSEGLYSEHTVEQARIVRTALHGELAFVAGD